MQHVHIPALALRLPNYGDNPPEAATCSVLNIRYAVGIVNMDNCEP